jgi:DNA polymerase-3 subunit gamma/tau
MSEFVVTARKWRPLFFKDVVGQEHITQTLKNAVLGDRIHHAYLFTGPRGVGKTTTARILSRSINCLNPQNAEPCNECENCKAVIDGRSMDIIEIDGASNNSVDDIRKLRENAKYAPSNGQYKVYIIDEVHMLSNAAFNALLKTLEEPPPHLIFVFATTEIHKVLPTITSRCQRFDFKRMEIDDITKQLSYISSKEGITIDEESLVTIAKKGDGSMRDAQSIFDQIISFCGKNIVYSELADALHLIDEDFFFSITSAVKEKDSALIFDLVGRVIRKGYDFQETLQGLLEHLRNLTAVKVTGNPEILETSSQSKIRFLEESKKFTKLDLLRMMNYIAQQEQALKFAPQPRIRFELALLQLANIDSTTEIQQLINELREVKKKGLTLGSQPEITISENINTYSARQVNKEPDNDNVKLPEPKYNNYSAEKLVNEWDNFINNEEITQAGLKLNKYYPKLNGKTITLTCSSDFEKQYLFRRLEEMELLVEKIYGLIVKFEIEVNNVNNNNIIPKTGFNYQNTTNNVVNNNFTANLSSNKNKIKQIADPNLHELERILIEDFGAELLMDFSKGIN